MTAKNRRKSLECRPWAESMDEAVVRIVDSFIIDDNGSLREGNFVIDEYGNLNSAKGDEDALAVIEASNRVFTRSLQNWHTHLPMMLNRSMGEGLELMDWLQTSIFPTEEKVNRELVGIGTKAAMAEAIRTGTTYVADMYHFPEAIGPVVADAGIRGDICGPTTTWPPSEGEDSGEALKTLEKLLPEGINDRVKYGVAAHAVYTCDEETLRRASELANHHDSMLHIHVSETRNEVSGCYERTGKYPAEYLDSIDFLGENVTAAHCGWLKKNEMRILAKHGVKAVHCPSSNQKLACGGTMSYPAMIEAGVDVRLGTDGAASNNSIDLRLEARMASMIQRHDHWDATILPPAETWALATKGSKDWVSWNLDDIRMRPIGKNGRRILANLIHSNADCLDVIVDDQILRRDGVSLSLDEGAIILELEQAAQEYYSHIK